MSTRGKRFPFALCDLSSFPLKQLESLLTPRTRPPCISPSWTLCDCVWYISLSSHVHGCFILQSPFGVLSTRRLPLVSGKRFPFALCDLSFDSLICSFSGGFFTCHFTPPPFLRPSLLLLAHIIDAYFAAHYHTMSQGPGKPAEARIRRHRGVFEPRGSELFSPPEQPVAYPEITTTDEVLTSPTLLLSPEIRCDRSFKRAAVVPVICLSPATSQKQEGCDNEMEWGRAMSDAGASPDLLSSGTVYWMNTGGSGSCFLLSICFLNAISASSLYVGTGHY